MPALTVLRKNCGEGRLTENGIADLGREGFIIKSARLEARTAVFIGGERHPKKFILCLDNTPVLWYYAILLHLCIGREA
jgi:hypothetical protein